MILSIDSDGFPPGFASRWEDTQSASDADGQLHFTDIPMVRVGSHVTVTLLCYTADGTLVSSGYSSGTATENGVPLEIGILGSAQIVLGSNSAPNGSTTEHDGATYDVIEYTGTGLEMAAVNTTVASTMEVKINGTVVSTTTDQSFTANLSDGYNAIEVTVTKGSNEPVVVRRNIYVVRQFSRPVIALGSNGTANGRTATVGGVDYQVIEYTGSGLGVTVTNGFEGNATFDVQVNGSSVSGTPVTGGATSVTATLADGFNAIVATLTESVNGSVQAEKYVYAVKKLVKPVITQSGGTANGKTASSGGKSYTVIEYEGTSPTVSVTNSYDGDGAGTPASVFTVTHNGSTASASMTLSDGFNAVVATLEKEHCVTQKDEKYYYVVKKLVKPVITMSGATPNGKTATSGGKTYTVIEYESTLPTVTITNSYDGSASVSYEAKLGTTVLSTACPSTITNHTLSDGFNAVTAALSEPYCDTLKDEKYYYVVKALTKPTVTYSDGMLTDEAADAGGYHMLRYSYLADPIVMPKFSVTNPYSDGSATMVVYLDGTALLTGDAVTGDISNRALTHGPHTIIITLSNDYCTEVSVTKKIKVAIKDVNVTVPSVHMIHNKNNSTRVYVTIDIYIDATNDGVDTTRQTMFSQTNWEASSGGWYYDGTRTMSNNTVTLTDPSSTFYFYTNHVADCGEQIYGYLPRNFDSATRTLEDLKDNRDFGKGSSPTIRVNSSGAACGASGQYSSYDFTVTLADKAYTEGTDDEPPSSP